MELPQNTFKRAIQANKLQLGLWSILSSLRISIHIWY
jgi:hypothetical protein